MSDAVKLLLSLSISGTLMAGLLILLRPLLKHRVSKSIQYYLWLIVLLRLAVPFSLEESLMNQLFHKKAITAAPVVVHTDSPMTKEEQDITSGPGVYPAVRNEAGKQSDTMPASSQLSIPKLFNQYAIGLWLLGVVCSLAINTTGYLRFSSKLRAGGRTAERWEASMLAELLGRSSRFQVKLIRSSTVASPMLIGLFRPIFVIPDTEYSETQLRNIMLHETIHLKRFDIGVKWFTMIVASVHWFNPFMYVIKKEMNRACELSCDEAVIRRLNTAEKQQYGETLISVASQQQSPKGVLRATFSEEKKLLRERLIAIMKHGRKPKIAAVVTISVCALIVCSAVALGASVGPATRSSTAEVGLLPVEPPVISVTRERESEQIGNVLTRKVSWDGIKYDQMSFYQSAWKSEPTLLTGLHRPLQGELFSIDFGPYTPDKVEVQMAYLTESYEESLLPILNVPVQKQNNSYQFINPQASTSDIPTTGRVYSITAEWGVNRSEYIFAADGKFDNWDTPLNYENDDYSFTLTLPSGWAGKYLLEERKEDDKVSFDFINGLSKSGLLFSVTVCPRETWERLKEEGQANLTKIGEKENNVYLFQTPSDVQYDTANERVKEDYDSMVKDLGAIQATFKLLG